MGRTQAGLQTGAFALQDDHDDLVAEQLTGVAGSRLQVQDTLVALPTNDTLAGVAVPFAHNVSAGGILVVLEGYVLPFAVQHIGLLGSYGKVLVQVWVGQLVHCTVQVRV